MELILGTAQLVRRYGITASRVPSSGDAHALLAAAREVGVRALDTAPGYGTAEATIGAR